MFAGFWNNKTVKECTVKPAAVNTTSKDSHGNPIKKKPDPYPIHVLDAPEWVAEPAAQNRDEIKYARTLYSPDAAKVSAHDTLILDGLEYDVDGDVGQWRASSTGEIVGYVLQVRRATG